MYNKDKLSVVRKTVRNIQKMSAVKCVAFKFLSANECSIHVTVYCWIPGDQIFMKINKNHLINKDCLNCVVPFVLIMNSPWW